MPHNDCALSPLQSTVLYTDDCEDRFCSNPIWNFAEGTTIVGLISNNDEAEYRKEIVSLVTRCQVNSLSLNVNKMKHLVIKFRKWQGYIHQFGSMMLTLRWSRASFSKAICPSSPTLMLWPRMHTDVSTSSESEGNLACF